MIDPDTFSALRLETFFPDRLPWRRKLYLFDAEYWDGLWHEDKVPGVSFLFPEADRKKLGVVTLLHPFEESTAPRSILHPDPAEMRLNALAVLKVLDLPLLLRRWPGPREASGRRSKGEDVPHSRIEGDSTDISVRQGRGVSVPWVVGSRGRAGSNGAGATGLGAVE